MPHADREERIAYHRAYYAKHKNRYLRKNKDTRLKRMYGISLSEQEDMLKAQGGACAICNSTEPNGASWHTDHDHETNEVRSILCGTCNRGLGYFKDNPATLRRAAAYLEKHNGLRRERERQQEEAA